jgi:AsmA protein
MKLAAPFADTEGISISGAVSSDLKVKGLPDTLHAEGHITLAKINAVYKDTQAALDGDLNFKYKPGSVHINKSSLTIQKIPVSLKGNVTGLKKTPKIDIDLSIAKSNAANLLAAAGPFVDTKDISLTGDIKADLNLRGMPSEIKTLKAGGNISLINMGIKYKDINAMINSSLALKSTNVQIKKADLKVEGVPVSAAGSVKNIIDSPSIDLSVSVPKTEASALQKLASNFTDLKDISLSGRLGADLRIKGRPEKIDTLKATGNVKLEKVGVKYNKIDAVLNGGLKIGEKLININLSTTYGRNSMQIKGTVANYFKNQDIKLNVYSKKLFIDELEPLLRITDKPSEVKKKTPSKSTAKQAEPDPVDLKLTASGEVKVNAAVYKGMDIKDFVMKYRFKDNWLNLTETGKAGKGSFNIKTLLNLSKRGYGYTMTGNIDSLHAEEIVNAFFPKARNKVFGIITSNLKLSGQGTLPENMKKHLKGSGNFHIKKGRISNAEIARELSLLVNIGELETIEFTKAEGTVNIGGGIAELNSIFTSNDISMDPQGNIGLDETLDLAFDLKLSPRLTDKAMSSKISQYIRDKGGWGTIPLLVTGSLSSPKYRVDVAKVGKKVIEKEVNKLLEKLINKGRDKERPKQPQEEDRTQEPADPLKDILKQLPGLFE